MCNFSEGTRFTSQKYEEAKLWCQKHDKPLPKHLLYPRTKGFVSTVQHLRRATHIKAVYDVAIAYQHGNKFMEAPDMLDSLIMGRINERHAYRFHAHVRRFGLNDLPQGDKELAKWLEERWLEKGEWLAEQKQRWAEEKQSQEMREYHRLAAPNESELSPK